MRSSRRNIRLGGLIGTLLQLAVVAGLLDAVQELLDEGGVLGLGPGNRIVLVGHYVKESSELFEIPLGLENAPRLRSCLGCGCSGCRGWWVQANIEGDVNVDTRVHCGLLALGWRGLSALGR
jgi:hypothetical protein